MSKQSARALTATDISKRYRIWDKPSARLTAPLKNKLRSLVGKEPCQGGYRDFQALAPLSLEVLQGECLGVIGKNGSGKSTLLQILAGTLQPSTGNVARHGRVGALLELGTGFNLDFTGRENMALYGSLNGLSQRQVEAIFDRVHEFSGLGDFIDQPLRTYSSGMTVRLAFSLLAHLDPDVLIIDEALAVGDAAFVQKCMRWLRDFIRRKTVILVSHDLSAITDLCTRAIWLQQGEVAFAGHPRRASELYLESIYDETTAASAAAEPEERLPADVDTGAPPDFRAASSDLQQSLSGFVFDSSAASFGKREATIEEVVLLDDHDNPIRQCRGGEIARLRVVVRAEAAIRSPIVGIGVKNRLGQELFHENTYLSTHSREQSPLEVPPGGRFVAEFRFRLPYFPAGDYFIFAAVATGTHSEHHQQHWLHEALQFTASPNRITLGLIGLPMIDVTLKHES